MDLKKERGNKEFIQTFFYKKLRFTFLHRYNFSFQRFDIHRFDSKKLILLSIGHSISGLIL
jgi:hypothetical protein